MYTQSSRSLNTVGRAMTAAHHPVHDRSGKISTRHSVDLAPYCFGKRYFEAFSRPPAWNPQFPQQHAGFLVGDGTKFVPPLQQIVNGFRELRDKEVIGIAPVTEK